jgi:SNF2 family DNA or RNA helicase
MFYSPEHNILAYKEIDESHVRHLQGVKPIPGYVAMPATVTNVQVLAHFGYDTPRIMDNNYDWPGRYTPFETQYITSNFLASHPRAFVLSDMGTGKTMAALWAADFLFRHVDMRCLIVCPLSIVQRVWADAIFENFMGRRTCAILHGTALKRKQLLAQPHDFYIINFDGVNTIKKELEMREDIQLVLIDEASAYRDGTTARHRVMRKTLQMRKFFWMMTGTPTSNGPLDAYGLAKLVNNSNGESFVHYKDRVMTRISNFKWVPKPGSHEEAHKMLQPSIRFSIDECVDLPACTVQRRDVELSEKQAKAYKIMKDTCLMYIESGRPITAANEAVMRLKLIQIACGAVYGQDREIHHTDAAPRINELKEIIKECREKIIIFAPLTSVVDMLHKELKDTYEVARINGPVSPKERSEIFRAFQETESPRILIADPGTMAHGLTLVAATCIIWYAPTDRTELYLQANARINRPGQTKTTTIVQLAATPIEREIYRRLESNETMQGLVLKLAKGDNGD